jgi:acetyl esterase/lipase
MNGYIPAFYRAGVLVGVLVLSGVFIALMADGERRLVEGVAEERTEAPFYQLPNPIPDGAPGHLFRTEELLSAPAGANAWRVIYHSRDVHGNNILVSGVVVAPEGDPPPGGRPVISWGHPTTGAAQHCAPSLGIDPFVTIEGLHEFLDAGYVVAATDYAGMGAAGPNSYLVGVTEGNNMLDAARAARQVPDAGTGNRVVLWGHSQGGQAALFAGQRALEYAPDLTLLGVAVAAPATDIGALFMADVGNDSGITIGSYALPAYASVYAGTPGVSLDGILTSQGIAAAEAIAPVCLLGHTRELHRIATPVIGEYLLADPETTEPWATLLNENSPGATGLTVPLLVAQGDADTLVHPDITRAYVEQERALGTAVTFRTFRDIDHGLIAMVAMPDVMHWLEGIGVNK